MPPDPQPPLTPPGYPQPATPPVLETQAVESQKGIFIGVVVGALLIVLLMAAGAMVFLVGG